jgi:hypothetical protein
MDVFWLVAPCSVGRYLRNVDQRVTYCTAVQPRRRPSSVTTLILSSGHNTARNIMKSLLRTLTLRYGQCSGIVNPTVKLPNDAVNFSPIFVTDFVFQHTCVATIITGLFLQRAGLLDALCSLPMPALHLSTSKYTFDKL